MSKETFGNMWWGSNLKLETFYDTLEIRYNTLAGSKYLRLTVEEVKGIFEFLKTFIEEESV